MQHSKKSHALIPIFLLINKKRVRMTAETARISPRSEDDDDDIDLSERPTLEKRKQRRDRALTLPRKMSELAMEIDGRNPLSQSSERAQVVAKMHLNHLACLPMTFEHQLCARCTIYARQQNLLPHTSNGLFQAPAQVPPEFLVDKTKEIADAAAQMRRERKAKTASLNHDAEEQQQQPAVSEIQTRDRSQSIGEATRHRHRRPAQLAATSPRDMVLIAEQRQRDNKVVGALSSLDYSWTELNTNVWCGLADTTRERLWVMQSMSLETSELTALPAFDLLLNNAYIPKSVYEQICKDLFRTFPDLNNKHFISALYSALVAYATLRPDIGYGQGMGHVIGVIALAISKPQQQLLVAEHVFTNVLPHYYSTKEALGSRIDGIVLDYYFQRQRPHDYSCFLEQFGAPQNLREFLIDFCWKHFSSMYALALPRTLALRIWDLVMLRGAGALFEFAVRYFHYLWKYDKIASCDHWIEASQLLTAMFARRNAEQQEKLYEAIARYSELPLGPIEPQDLLIRRRIATQKVFESIRAAADAKLAAQ